MMGSDKVAIAVLVIGFGFVILVTQASIERRKQDQAYLKQAPKGSHIEYYSEAPHSYPTGLKVVYPSGRVWYPYLQPTPPEDK